MLEPNQFPRIPKAPYDRRAYAFFLDFIVTFIISIPFADQNLRPSWLQALVFSVVWLFGRAIIPLKNQGQTLGRWAFDLKLADLRHKRSPGLQELFKRELITLGGGILVLIGIEAATLNPFSLFLLMLPLLGDGVVAFSNPETRQAGHDMVARTIVVQTRRGFSLDLKIKKWLGKIKYFMRK